MERYNSFNNYLKKKFGSKVFKITIDAGFTCPNRDGSKGRDGCIYCDEFGSGNSKRGLPIKKQVEDGIKFYRSYKPGGCKPGSKDRNARFIVYFQAFSNTYEKSDVLRNVYKKALISDDIVGISIGTRPDTIDEEKLDIIEEFRDRYELWLEYGLQSASDKTLKFINRGHTVEDFIEAVKITKKRNIKICAHIIIGLPGESHADFMRTAALLTKLNIDGVKIHSIYVNRGTELEKLYRIGKFNLISLNEYVDAVVDFLERLPSEYIIQRITGEGNRDLMIAPDWAFKKLEVINRIKKELERRNTFQGKKLI